MSYYQNKDLNYYLFDYITNDIIKFIYKKSNWFENVFKFTELKNYNENRNKILKLYKNNSINCISCGQFSIKTIQDFKEIENKNKGNISFKNIIGDIREIILNPKNANAIFQIASQFNCLEMIDPYMTPADGVTIYENDHTQGPIASLCAPTAIAYRNYIINSNKKQLNTLEQVEKYLPKSLWKIKNGYLLFENEKNLLILNKLLSTPKNEEIFRKNIGIGVHKDVGVCDIYSDNPKETHRVTQVFCSGFSINYNTSIKNKKLWEPFSTILLDTIYELTLIEACKSGSPCYLTMVGGGVFGMSHKLIKNSIIKACQRIADRGLSLEVILVHYGNINNNYLDIPIKF